MDNEELQLKFPSQGWQQLLVARRRMLDAFDQARQQAMDHRVQVFHGIVGEGRFREWLANFLPKKYGVTSGRIISPGIDAAQKPPHFDVIIYDQLEAPVLWIEEHPDGSPAGYARAIPVEHVLCVLEVKSTFSTKAVTEAIGHLEKLSPLMSSLDQAGERYKKYLPPCFTCGLVFFDLKVDEAYNEAALSHIVSAHLKLRRFFGGLVLRGEGHQKPVTGRITFLQGKEAHDSFIAPDKQSLLYGAAMSRTLQLRDDLHIGAMVMWAEMAFAQFGFDLIAMMQGTYESGRLSSWYGIGRT
jgi:hypothetical protein